MEVECPDVWPEIRVLPSGYEVQWVRCCGGWFLFYGVVDGIPDMCWHLFKLSTTGETKVAVMGHPAPWTKEYICGLWETSAKVSGESGRQCC